MRKRRLLLGETQVAVDEENRKCHEHYARKIVKKSKKRDYIAKKGTKLQNAILSPAKGTVNNIEIS